MLQYYYIYAREFMLDYFKANLNDFIEFIFIKVIYFELLKYLKLIFSLGLLLFDIRVELKIMNVKILAVECVSS